MQLSFIWPCASLGPSLPLVNLESRLFCRYYQAAGLTEALEWVAMLRPLPLFWLLALLLGPTDAAGASKAEKLFRAGERAEKQGDFETAFERFAGAVSLKPDRADWLLPPAAGRPK